MSGLTARLRGRTPSRKAEPAPDKPVALVTGGSGFLGRHLVAALVESADYANVVVFDVRPSPDARAESIVGDLRDPASVSSAFKGARGSVCVCVCGVGGVGGGGGDQRGGLGAPRPRLQPHPPGVDVVFHCATAAVTAANAAARTLMTDVNVGGTKNVISACANNRVNTLIFTSSASVVFDGRDLDGVDESKAYAQRPMDYYTATKIEAEKLILAAHAPPSLSTIALRPSGIFGEHDALLVPTAVAKAKQGKMKYTIGGGKNLMDWTYAGNVAAAHLAAARALADPTRAPSVGGRPFFVTNDDPRPFWTFMGDLLEPLGYGRPHVNLPYWPLYIMACMYAAIIAVLRPFIAIPASDFTPMRITISAATRRLDCGAAMRELGYRPAVSIEAGVARTVASFAALAAPGAPVLRSGAKGRPGRSRSRSRGRARA